MHNFFHFSNMFCLREKNGHRISLLANIYIYSSAHDLTLISRNCVGWNVLPTVYSSLFSQTHSPKSGVPIALLFVALVVFFCTVSSFVAHVCSKATAQVKICIEQKCLILNLAQRIGHWLTILPSIFTWVIDNALDMIGSKFARIEPERSSKTGNALFHPFP